MCSPTFIVCYNTSMENGKNADIAKKEAQLALSIFDMIDEFKDNPDLLEHIDVITFNLHNIFGDDIIDWYSIGDFCDSVAYSMRHDDSKDIADHKEMLDFKIDKAKAKYIAQYGPDKQ